MKLQTLRRGTAAAAVLAMSLSFAACGSDDEGSDAGTDTETSETTTEEEPAPADEPTEDAAAGEFEGVFGPACGDLPQGADDGSLESMVADPVATAASTNPLLTTLVAAVGAVEGLAGTLDSAPADPGLTVFAPANTAFEALGEEAVNGLVTEAQEATGPDAMTSPLATVLAHHVLPESFDPEAIVGDQTTLIGDTLTIDGDPEAGMTVTDGEVTANIVCGGIPTANATVYVIDSVLTNAVPAS